MDVSLSVLVQQHRHVQGLFQAGAWHCAEQTLRPLTTWQKEAKRGKKELSLSLGSTFKHASEPSGTLQLCHSLQCLKLQAAFEVRKVDADATSQSLKSGEETSAACLIHDETYSYYYLGLASHLTQAHNCGKPTS